MEDKKDGDENVDLACGIDSYTEIDGRPFLLPVPYIRQFKDTGPVNRWYGLVRLGGRRVTRIDPEDFLQPKGITNGQAAAGR